MNGVAGRRVLPVVALVVLVGLAVGAGDRARDRGYAEGFADGASAAVEAVEQADPDGAIATVVLPGPDPDRWEGRPGIGFGGLLVPLLVVWLALRFARPWGGGGGPRRPSRGDPPAAPPPPRGSRPRDRVGGRPDVDPEIDWPPDPAERR